MKAKLLFVRDPKNFYSIAPLLAIAFYDASLDVDLVAPKKLSEHLVSNIGHDRIIVAFSLNSIGFLEQRSIILDVIKKYRDRAVFVAGGPHPSARPELFLDLGFNAVAVGSGEAVMQEFISIVKKGGIPSGIYSKKVDSLDTFPPYPEKPGYYKPIELTRGCPYGCFFCQASYLFPKKPVHRSIENVLCHVRRAFQERIRDFRFVTPNSLGYCATKKEPNNEAIKRLISGIREIIGSKGRIFFGTFPSEVRPEFVKKEVINYLHTVIDNQSLIIGAQSGSDRMLRASHRGHSVRDVENAIDVCLSAGFSVDIDIIIGMPGETKENLQESITFINKYQQDGVKFHLHYFIPLPGTPWENERPVPISQDIRHRLSSLVGRGRAWGTWERQIQYSRLLQR